MRYNSREEVERIGRAGVHHFVQNDHVVARQMSSYWICIDPTDKGYSPHAMHDGFWEAWITLWMSKNIRPGSVCVDVGANFGFYTFYLAQHNCKVYAFDPSPLCINLLQKSNELNATSDRVVIENYAVTDGATKEIELWKVEGHMMNTTIKQNPAQLDDFFTSKAVSLDDYFQRKADGGKIEFIKIDAEGSEDLIWKGMQKTLQRNPGCKVLMEFVPGHYPQNGELFLKELLEKCHVSYVDYAGVEQSITNTLFFRTDREPFRMLVLILK